MEAPSSPTANDRRDPHRRQVLPAALSECAANIGAHLRGELPAEAMRDAVRHFASHVQIAGVPPERALVLLKQTVLRVPEVARRPAIERGDVLRLLVQDAIVAYYSLSDADPPAMA